MEAYLPSPEEEREAQREAERARRAARTAKTIRALLRFFVGVGFMAVPFFLTSSVESLFSLRAFMLAMAFSLGFTIIAKFFFKGEMRFTWRGIIATGGYALFFGILYIIMSKLDKIKKSSGFEEGMVIVACASATDLTMMPPNTALERTAAPLVRSTVAAIRERVVRSTVPVGGCRSAWVR